jgi:ketosteroid isomerase-like protein
VADVQGGADTTALILEKARMTMIGNPADVADVRQVFDRWLSAVRACSLDGVAANHADDVLMFDVADPPQTKGLSAYRATWEGFFPWFGADGVFDPSELSITAGGEVAFSTCLVRCVGSTPSDVEKPVRLTLCYRKVGGQWQIAHEHHSVAWEIAED